MQHPYDDPFDPHAPEKQLKARKFPWRPVWLLAALAVVVAIAWGFDRNVVNEWWATMFGREDKRPAKNLLANWNINAGDWEPTPPREPEPIVLHVERRLPALAANTPAPAAPTPAPPPAAAPIVAPRRTGIDIVSFVPQNQAPLRMVDGRIPEQAAGCSLIPGVSEIHATLKDEVRFDMGGPIEATVTRPVLSPERPDWVLIPEGANLVGRTSPERIQRGMDLAPAPVWHTVSWRDSETGQVRSRMLHNAAGADVNGVNGMGGIVDQRWGTVAALVAVTTVTDFISSISVSLGDSDSVNARIGGGSAGRIMEKVAEQYLDLQPIITRPAGTQIIVKPTVAIRMC